MFSFQVAQEYSRIALEPPNQKENKMTLGERLRQLRTEKSWTQPQAAETIGIEQSYLSKLENDNVVA
ncbi:helix-turn-helix domain-containing protein [Marinimicrobium sp. ABcell2]|uniref:helix-turn-helix domain-containing protein n=1 Tax=Marinimicrobium sp. ABcell2 TaxID=3069751 RepID=UPI0027B2BCD5|nr:helix-turn-helix transcriptional regulator [Marinimicrobium sp. ABcell2]MDQ2077737.1 helix-turn-helix transcriptional regulator [Marinimicrobium sp. ABcell2]